MANQAGREPASVVNKDREVILRTIALTKVFGKLVAVKNLNLELHRGEVFGLLGPNGAGKSTTVGMILGLIAPTGGSVEAFGLKFEENRWSILRRVGAIVDSPAFYPYLSGWDNLEVIARALGGIPGTKIGEVLDRVNLADRARDKYGHYSQGMKQRLGIASTLLRDPELIMLDEPTNGLDPAGTREVRELIPRLAHEGRTILLCSHLLHEVEQVCDTVAILKEGIMLTCAPVKELMLQGHTLQVRVDDPDAAVTVLRGLPWVNLVKREGDYLIVSVSRDRASQVSAALAEHRIFPSELVSHSVSLEDVFLELTEGKNSD